MNYNKLTSYKIILASLLSLLCLALSSCKRKEIIHNKSFTHNQEEQREVNLTIFVHGTHTQPLTKLFKKYIYGPKEGLCELTALHPRCYMRYAMELLANNNYKQFPIDSFYTFSWSGKLSGKARIDDSKLLYKAVQGLIQKHLNAGKIPKITIITHSHGGNVTLNLANINEENPEFEIEKLILLACPVQGETKHLAKNKMFKKVYNIYSTVDMLQVMDPQGIKSRNRHKNYPIFSQRKFESADNLKQAAIKINDHSLWHIEFITDKFISILPDLLSTMDTLDCSNNARYLIRANTKDNSLTVLKNKNK